MNQDIHYRRLQKTKELMEEQGVDIFFVSPSSNLRYLSGYSLPACERLFFLVLPARGEPFALVNTLYHAQAEIMPVSDFVFWSDGEDAAAILRDAVKRRGMLPAAKAAVDPSLPALFSIPMRRSFPETEFVLGSALTNLQRQYKNKDELDCMRRSSALLDGVLESIAGLGEYWIGKTEKELAWELGARMRSAGFETWDSIIAAGAGAAEPHHVTGNAVIQRGMGLLIDFWGSFEGYFTDCSRTFFVGEPDPEFEKVYRIVLEAHLSAEAAASKPGILLGDVDAAARSVIEGYGYGGCFTHRTGHGIGMDVHEGAGPSPGEKTQAAPGMAFSIEPGIYLPGKLGVRIENVVVLGEKCIETLHKYPRDIRRLV
ncbi:MAG: Xaa-Pro peptidase family protein [Treponema sp.]|jgi:Xaa-Pro dipeptidase|nr:Xaa-Pro peptidase family protein [Treponema sp.]